MNGCYVRCHIPANEWVLADSSEESNANRVGELSWLTRSSSKEGVLVSPEVEEREALAKMEAHWRACWSVAAQPASAGEYVLCMPWAQRNLAMVVAMERVPRNPDVVQHIVRQLAGCLAHIHSRGLVHGEPTADCLLSVCECVISAHGECVRGQCRQCVRGQGMIVAMQVT